MTNLYCMLAEGGVVETTAKTFGVDMPHLVAQIVSFSIVAFLLHRFAYKPILLVLEARKAQIAESIANADKIKAELAQTAAERQKILNQANLEANRVILEARAAAVRVQEIETQKAIAAAEQIILKAREATAIDQARMRGELRQEIGRLVVATTARVAGKVLTPEDQSRLIEEANRQLAA